MNLISIGHNKLEYSNITQVTYINDTFSSVHKQLNVYTVAICCSAIIMATNSLLFNTHAGILYSKRYTWYYVHKCTLMGIL